MLWTELGSILISLLCLVFFLALSFIMVNASVLVSKASQRVTHEFLKMHMSVDMTMVDAMMGRIDIFFFQIANLFFF